MPKRVVVKRVNVSGTVTEELNEFIEEFRWSNRLSKSDVISTALVSWAGGHGFSQPAINGDAPETAETADVSEAPDAAESGMMEATDQPEANAAESGQARKVTASRRR